MRKRSAYFSRMEALGVVHTDAVPADCTRSRTLTLDPKTLTPPLRLRSGSLNSSASLGKPALESWALHIAPDESERSPTRKHSSPKDSARTTAAAAPASALRAASFGRHTRAKINAPLDAGSRPRMHTDQHRHANPSGTRIRHPTTPPTSSETATNVAPWSSMEAMGQWPGRMTSRQIERGKSSR